MTHAEYVSALKYAAVTLLKNRAMIAIAALFPILATGPLGFIMGQVVSKIITLAIENGEILAFFQFIDLRTSVEGRDFEKAIQSLSKAQTPQEKLDAEKILIDTARTFIRISS